MVQNPSGICFDKSLKYLAIVRFSLSIKEIRKDFIIHSSFLIPHYSDL